MKNENQKETYSYKGWLVSDSFVKRVVAVTLYQIFGSFIISFALFFVVAIPLIVGVSLFGIRLTNNNIGLGGQPENQDVLQKDRATNSSQDAIDVENKKDLLVGSWVDTSDAGLDFTLNADGTAKSDGMATLLYKNWRRIGNNKVSFVIKSVGNGSSSTEEEVNDIVKLTDKEMILKDGDYTMKYVKKQK